MTAPSPSISILIPAHNEAGYIRSCLGALLGSDPVQARVEIWVIANACTDDTADTARAMATEFAAKGWALNVHETASPGKLNALNEGDARSNGDVRIYLDADVTVSPGVVAALATALAGDRPRYASGAPKVIAPKGWIMRRYAQFWARLDFVAKGVPGFGLFAVNAAGRARWDAFPDIISDDTFVRLNFAAPERIRTSEPYDWPLVDGIANLIKVRRRQDVGVREVADRFPTLMANDDIKNRRLGTTLRHVLADPVGFIVYAAISVAVRLPILRSNDRWARGR